MMLALVYLLGLGSGAGLGWWFTMTGKELARMLDREYGAGYDSGFDTAKAILSYDASDSPGPATK